MLGAEIPLPWFFLSLSGVLAAVILGIYNLYNHEGACIIIIPTLLINGKKKYKIASLNKFKAFFVDYFHLLDVYLKMIFY